MIGLKRGIVKITPSDKSWRQLFDKEKKRLKEIFGDAAVDIQHIGSTSIPGLSAKPVIDIDVGVKSMGGSSRFIKYLFEAGYHYRSNASNPKYHMVFAKGVEKKRTHYIHIVKFGGIVWKRDLAFRDYLRTHKRAMKEYENLKKKLEKKFSTNRPAYTAGKTAFIRAALRRTKDGAKKRLSRSRGQDSLR
ncbi:GrpB family protein [bacterium]|nr:GrpB family protein [bacterium]MCI0566285.1 GrpB family protein [bacterium]MCI0680287.1 GrpB family protein [bacterium]